MPDKRRSSTAAFSFLKAGEDHKPGSVPRPGYPEHGDDHSSGTAVARRL